jgi:hypothetical protein
MKTSVAKDRSFFAGLAVALSLTAGGAWAQEIIIDAGTGQPISLGGLSDPAMDALRSGGTVQTSSPGGGTRVIRGEVYIPGTWVDPDGCEHWVMDDGIEGYMAPKLTRHGKPICNTGAKSAPPQLMVHTYDVPYEGKYGGKW